MEEGRCTWEVLPFRGVLPSGPSRQSFTTGYVERTVASSTEVPVGPGQFLEKGKLGIMCQPGGRM